MSDEPVVYTVTKDDDTRMPLPPNIAHEGTWILLLKRPLPPQRKTPIYDVVLKNYKPDGPASQYLAEIRWYPPWRLYALFPKAGTVFEATCLLDLTVMLQALMQEYKNQKGAACG